MSEYKKYYRRVFALVLLLALMSIAVFGCRDNKDPSSSVAKSSSRSQSQMSSSESVLTSEPKSEPSVSSKLVSSRKPASSVSPASSKPVPSASAAPSSSVPSTITPPKVKTESVNILVNTASPSSLNIDLTFHSNSPKPTPIAILFHGGNWSAGDHSYTSLGGLEFYKDKLVEAGYAVASCEYIRGVSTQFPNPGKSPKPTDNAVLIIKFILSLQNASEYFYNPENVILIGENAGGHTALMAALGNEKYFTAAGKEINFSAVIAISSVLDLNDLLSRTATPSNDKNSPAEKLIALQNAAKNFAGVEYIPQNYQKYKDLSPNELLLNAGSGLYILGVLSNDLPVYLEQASHSAQTANSDIDIFNIVEDNPGKLWESINETLKNLLSFDE